VDCLTEYNDYAVAEKIPTSLAEDVQKTKRDGV
jgi:hypothetical protein